MFNLKDLQAKFESSSQPAGSLFYNDFLQIGNIEIGADEPTVIRFLPDLLNPENPFYFYEEQNTHSVKVDGKWVVQACQKKHSNKNCPFCNASAAYYDRGDKDGGKTYLSKKFMVLQVILVSTPVIEDDPTSQDMVGKVVNLKLTKAFLKDILAKAKTLGDVVFLDENGADFEIRVGKDGDWRDYSQSAFSRSNRDIKYSEYKDGMKPFSELVVDLPTAEEVDELFEKTDAGTMAKHQTSKVVSDASEALSLVNRD